MVDALGPDRFLGAVRTALAERDAAAFLHAGRGDAPTLRYLLGRRPPDSPCVVVVAEDGPRVFVARGEEKAQSAPHPVETCGDPGRAGADWLADNTTGSVVLAPRHVPHDVAVHVERAGRSLASTTAVREARARKREGEQARVCRATRAAAAGGERARAVLREATVDETGEEATLTHEGRALDRERLSRATSGAVVEAGADPDTSVTTDALRPGAPVVVRAAPRVGGYHGVVARTLVVGGDGGWERRAHVACESARRAALDAIEPGATLAGVREEVVGELRAFGVESAGEPVHGVGLARRERPLPGEATTLAPGHALVVAPTVAGERGRVALADTALVTEAGSELPADAATRLSP